MLQDAARELDHWIVARNLERRAEGTILLKPCTLKVFGQMALIEVGAALTLVATKDVDVRANYEFVVEQEFRRLLALRRMVLDAVAHEAWMPVETRYRTLFKGEFVALAVADTESILVSKALKAPLKNRSLLTEYLAKGASARFLKLARKYGVDLERFV